MSYSFFSSIEGFCVIIKEFGLTGEQEGSFSTIKETTKLMCNGHANHMIQKSLLRIQAENLMSKCFMQQSHLTETVKNDLIFNMTAEARSKTLPNMSKPSLFSSTLKETTEQKRHFQRGKKLNQLKSDNTKR